LGSCKGDGTSVGLGVTAATIADGLVEGPCEMAPPLGPGVTDDGDAQAARASATHAIPNVFLVSNALSLTRACPLDIGRGTLVR
jgi:hypothetical protein